MTAPLYPTLLLAALVFATSTAGCKKHGPTGGSAAAPGEQGKLRRIGAALDEAYGNARLPTMTEAESFAERLAKWDDFRACTVRTYVARKRDAVDRARAGIIRPTRHAGIGDEAVEECAVQSAIVNKDPSVCQRLAGDYAGPSGEVPLSAVRCWDTRARIFGLPGECPVVWSEDDRPARNPECLALARRDASLCPFAASPARCRALLANNQGLCPALAEDPSCPLALTYWNGLIPAGVGPPLLDEALKSVHATFDLRWQQGEHVRIEAPQRSCGLSWPGETARAGWTESTTAFWGAELSANTAQITWRQGRTNLKLAFAPGAAHSGALPLEPPAPGAAATIVIVWADPRAFRRCQPGPLTKGQVRFDAGAAGPGTFVTGNAEATGLACSDGTTVDLETTFRAVILDVR